jgi:hypothetical protein
VTVLASRGRGRLAPASPSGTRPNRATVAALSLLGGIAYFSWPLGYIVNRAVVEGGLASDLEVPGQPFSWVFVLLDIVSGLLIMAIVILYSRASTGRTRTLSYRELAGYAIFGLTTAASAAVPLQCGQGMRALLACGTTTSRYDLHDLLSLLGYFALFGSILWALAGSDRWHARGLLAFAMKLFGILWSICGLLLMVAVLAHWPQVECQHVFLALTSVVIALVPVVLAQPNSTHPADHTDVQVDSTAP